MIACREHSIEFAISHEERKMRIKAAECPSHQFNGNHEILYSDFNFPSEGAISIIEQS